ncbi:hypothetical protein JTB14_017599 [Gonioctena quinquepunctata]|nr:hypothetical protein JTB14_017599 [Gonioctena quinquepunctata]
MRSDPSRRPNGIPTLGNIGIEYEDDYFEYLSNPESDDETENSYKNFLISEKILDQRVQHKNSTGPNYTEVIENPPIAVVENVEIPQNKLTNVEKQPTCLYPITKITRKPILEKLKIEHKGVKPLIRSDSQIINQVDGPTDTSDGYTSRSEDESNQDLYMRKKKQTKRNAKRRKTYRTKEEIEIDQEERKETLERMEKEKTELATQENAQKPKPAKKDKNKEKVPYQEQLEQTLQEFFGYSPFKHISEEFTFGI